MRIEAYTNVQQVYQSQRVDSKVKQAQAAKGKDELHISSVGRDIQIAKTALKTTPNIREDIVAGLKARIKEGTYEVKTEDFAEKLLEKYC